MTAAQTSIFAYHALSEKVLNRCQQIVFDHIKANPGCDDREIADATGLDKSNVNGRRNELEKMERIECTGTAVNEKTGMPTKRYKVKEEW